MTDLTGETIVITGATSGIGEATAIAFAQRYCACRGRNNTTRQTLDVLINTAGGTVDPKTLSTDGIESTFALNTVAPFAQASYTVR